jgi:cellulose synthase/poly-beta-1,6-N-acetylglucosamine synthase-like glycosyltransferase
MEGTLRYHKKKSATMESVSWATLQEIGKVPSVLVIIPTYHEGVGILKKTLDAILLIDYPRDRMTVVVGDDGKDDKVQEFLATSYPLFFYHRRMLLQGHAKAGNINDILFASEDTTINYINNLRYPGDYVLILDCDMIPEPDILKNMLPIFWDHETGEEVKMNDRCAFVQSPQAFYNIHGFDWLGQHYLFFYQVVQKAYSGFSLGVPCCGTNVIFYRKILMDIGGFQYGSVTEDFNTSLLLHSQGFVSKYYTGKTAFGMAPLSLVGFYEQRKRWSIGGLQIIFSPLFFQKISKLPILYKWIYIFSGASPFLAIFLFFLMIGPLLDLFYHDTLLCHLDGVRYLSFFLPYAIVYLSCLVYLHYSLSWKVMITSFQETLFMVFMSLRFIASFITKKAGFRHFTFKTTQKSIEEKPAPRERLSLIFILLPYVLFYLLVITGILLKGINQNLDGSFLIDIFWLVLIMAQLVPVLFYFIQGFVMGP